ncbi:uncharacterized protein (TIGR02646 family) [Arcicella aurantiaca]|uniref:Uncharacterized protein (TIGR02646 family) n=1 Tax=Arcicella aurantiaca TaxID=591202 RepID=A0A316EVC1_9BACT|nr:hypothetical protein [Arcicella aurantiaca]PWK27136.1 uncharacterized protein (TIGR02646 family) [Arcicella aurantiaca]
MISISKDFKNPPKKLLDSKRNDLIKDSLITKNKHKFNGSVYRKTTIEALEALYNHKCAYCETDTSAGAPLQVEHFRPKAKVDNIEEDPEHYGYYWLAYEWSNLTLGCSKCNNAKKNHFPITGNRLSEPISFDANGLPTDKYLQLNSETLLAEKPVLLNPEIDEVEKHFYFLPNGEIKGLSDRGQQTIEILKLNRNRLIFWRKKLVDDCLNDISNTLEDFIAKRINIETCQYYIRNIFSKIAQQQHPSKQYSRFDFFMFSKFEIFFGNQLQPKQRQAVMRFFEMYREGTL